MKRKIAIFVMLAICISCINTCNVFAARPINVTINDNELIFFDQRPVIRNDRVLVPMRNIFEALGADVEWDSQTQTAIGTLGEKIVKTTIGSVEGYVGEEKVILDAGAQLINDRTMVPIRFISESLGAEVDWISETQTVTIQAELGETGGVPNIHPKGTKRPVPTEFEKSSELTSENLLYFDMPQKSEEAMAKLQGGQVIMNTEDFLSNKRSSQGMPEFGTMEQVQEDGETVIRLSCTKKPSADWEMNYRINLPDDFEFETGDLYLIKAKARLVEGGDFDTRVGKINIGMSEGSRVQQKLPGTGLGSVSIPVSGEWTDIYYGNVLNREINDNYDYYMSLMWSYETQVIDIKDIEFLYWQQGEYTLDDLPTSKRPYDGYEPDAQWRKDALSKIEQTRKGDINVVVKDAQGNVIPDADVSIDMFEHEFFWSNLQSGGWKYIENGLTGMEGDSEYEVKRREVNVENFNSVTTLIHKQTYEEEDNKGYIADQNILDWSNANGIDKSNRGHALLWDFDLESLIELYGEECFDGTDYAKALLRDKIIEHIYYVADVHPTLDDIDVSNEDSQRNGMGFAQQAIKPLYGKEFLIDVYKAARGAFPNAELALTDGFGSAGENNAMWTNEQKPFLDWAVETLDFDVIGHQGHTSYNTTPEKLVKTMEALASYGKKVRVTEFDCSVNDDVNYQGNLVRDSIIAYFACDAVDKINFWGVQDYNEAGTQRPLYYYDYLDIKPGGKAFQDLVYNKWWTRETGKTDSNGSFATRGYYGDYTITASVNGNSAKVDVHLGKNDPREVVIVIE